MRERFFWTLLISALALLSAGCATNRSPDEESDMPWNMPQPWESAPSLPGMDGP